MTFEPAAWHVRRAREALNQWNEEHPDDRLAWETMEECLLSFRRWKETADYAPEEALVACARFQEFARQLPRLILDNIFPGVS
jgi:ferric-dicitrate binding protein FerR (iron transport regulator)